MYIAFLIFLILTVFLFIVSLLSFILLFIKRGKKRKTRDKMLRSSQGDSLNYSKSKGIEIGFYVKYKSYKELFKDIINNENDAGIVFLAGAGGFLFAVCLFITIGFAIIHFGDDIQGLFFIIIPLFILILAVYGNIKSFNKDKEKGS